MSLDPDLRVELRSLAERTWSDKHVDIVINNIGTRTADARICVKDPATSVILCEHRIKLFELYIDAADCMAMQRTLDDASAGLSTTGGLLVSASRSPTRSTAMTVVEPRYALQDNSSSTDYVSILNLYSQRIHQMPPVYEDSSMGNLFGCTCLNAGRDKVLGRASESYSTKRLAKQQAAKNAVEQLRHDGLAI